MFLTLLAPSKKVRVIIVSLMFSFLALIVPIIVVCALPPKLSLRSSVSTDPLYGTNWGVLDDDTLCCKVAITFLRAYNDKLILAASVLRYPVAPVCFNFSLPAKSTKFIFEYFMIISPDIFCLVSTDTVRIEWDLEEDEFMLVVLVALTIFPFL